MDVGGQKVKTRTKILQASKNRFLRQTRKVKFNPNSLNFLHLNNIFRWWIEWLCVGFSRWESHRAGCGPQAGAEGAGGGVHLSAEACGSVSQQRQDFLDCESNTWLLDQTSSVQRMLHTQTRAPSHQFCCFDTNTVRTVIFV